MQQISESAVEYGSAQSLADEFGVSRMTVWRWAKKGMIPAPIKLSPCITRFDMKQCRENLTALGRANSISKAV